MSSPDRTQHSAPARPALPGEGGEGGGVNGTVLSRLIGYHRRKWRTGYELVQGNHEGVWDNLEGLLTTIMAVHRSPMATPTKLIFLKQWLRGYEDYIRRYSFVCSGGYAVATRWLRGCYAVATRLLRGGYAVATRWQRGCYAVATRLLRGCYAVATRLLRGGYAVATRWLRGCYDVAT